MPVTAIGFPTWPDRFVDGDGLDAIREREAFVELRFRNGRFVYAQGANGDVAADRSASGWNSRPRYRGRKIYRLCRWNLTSWCRNVTFVLTLVTRLPLPRIADLHRLRFLAATIFVPLEDVMVFIDDLDHFADFLLHAGNPFVFRRVGKRLGRGIVVAFGKHDAGAHVVDPGADEFLFDVVVAVNSHA